jgi:hypothetical protein
MSIQDSSAPLPPSRLAAKSLDRPWRRDLDELTTINIHAEVGFMS